MMTLSDYKQADINKVYTSDTEAAFCICPFLMVLFLPKLTMNVTILILKLSISHFDGDVSRFTSY